MKAAQNASAIKPFARPRHVDVARTLAMGRWVSHGDCYRYAFREALRYLEAGSPSPALQVVHGTVSRRGNEIPHAWVERGDFAYDWQTLALDRGAGPVPLAEFYAERHARKVKVYTAMQATAAVETGHYGPWD